MFVTSVGSGGSARQPDGELLADLPDILGLEAYTHDQLVAKDERQEVKNLDALSMDRCLHVVCLILSVRPASKETT